MSETLTPEPATDLERKIEGGSAGWTVDELDDPRFEGPWNAGHFELVNGVIVKMAPARFDGVSPVGWLLRTLMESPKFRGGAVFSEVDMQIASDLIFRPDQIWMSPEDYAKHRAHAPSQSKRSSASRLEVPPTLAIEAISPGYERHDRVLKFDQYAKFGIPNYWIVDGFAKRMDCFILRDGEYSVDAAGKDADVLRPTLFSPTEIHLAKLWV